MEPVWQQLLIVFGGNAALVAVFAYLVKSLLAHRLTKDIKVFEVELKAKADASMEQLKNELQVAAIEHQVRFSKLHEKRGEVIAELYKRLVEAFWASQRFASPMEWAGEPTKAENYVEAAESLRQFFIYFEVNRVYLPESICTQLDRFIADVRSPVIRFGVYLRIEHPTDKTLDAKMDAWIKAAEAFEKDIPQARRALEAEFRRILGGSAET